MNIFSRLFKRDQVIYDLQLINNNLLERNNELRDHINNQNLKLENTNFFLCQEKQKNIELVRDFETLGKIVTQIVGGEQNVLTIAYFFNDIKNKKYDSR